MSRTINTIRIQNYGASALLLLLTIMLVSPVFGSLADAAPLSTRSIRLSDSSPSATNVVYRVGVTVANAATNIGGIVIDFCYNSPIIGDTTCSTPTGLNSNFASLTIVNQSNISGLSVDTVNSTATKVILTKAAGAPTAAAISFELGNGSSTGFTNPSTVSTSGNQGTFYARIYTYTTAAAAQSHNTTAPAGYTDASGVAISAASQLAVTAKVQESLSFCVYTGASCSTGVGSGLALGDANGVLSSTVTTYTNTSKYDLASNAQNGVVVRLKGDTLKSGSFSIDPQINAGACQTDSTAGTTEQFGLRLSVVGTGQTAQSPYNCTSGNHGLDVSTTCTTGEENVTCLYGDRLSTTGGPSQNTTPTTVEYSAKAATTTEAGIYTTSMRFIATATY